MTLPSVVPTSVFPRSAAARWRRLFVHGPALAAVCCAALVLGLVPDEARAQGALSNGGVHSGVISSAGEVDAWTFTATSGDSIVVAIGEIGGDSDFYPYVRLVAPNAAVVTWAGGAQATRISAAAPQTGTYTV